MLAEERETDPRFKREFAWRSKLEGGKARPRDKKWLQRCFAILKQRIASGYPLPLTFRHSDDSPQLAGSWTPTRIGLATANPGEAPRETIFVDRVYRDEATYRLAKTKFPYTSPELSPDYPEEVDALSHLSEAPYNKFAVPPLKELFRDVAVNGFYRSSRAVALPAWRQRTPKEMQSVQAAGSALASRGLNSTEVPVMDGDNETETPPATMADAGGLPPQAAPGGDDDVKSLLKQLIEAHTKGHAELMACMRSMVTPKGETETMATEDGDEQVDDEALDKKDPPVDMTAQPAVYRALKALRSEVTRMRTTTENEAKARLSIQGEVAALRKSADTLRAEKATGALVAKATERLRGIGFELEPEDVKAIHSAAAKGADHVEALVSGYTRGMERAGPSLGGYGFAVDEPQVDDETPPEVAEILKMGGAAAEHAKTLMRTWNGLDEKAKSRLGGDVMNLLYERDVHGNKVIPGSNGKRPQKAKG